MKLTDNVIARIAQIVQEAILTGTDCIDLLREIEVIQAPADESSLILTPEYELKVIESHNQLLEKAKRIQEERAQGASNIIGTQEPKFKLNYSPSDN